MVGTYGTVPYHIFKFKMKKRTKCSVIESELLVFFINRLTVKTGDPNFQLQVHKDPCIDPALN